MAATGIPQAPSPAKESRHVANVFACEQPMREIRSLSIAASALALANSDELPGGEEARDEAIRLLNYFIWQRINLIDGNLFPNGQRLTASEGGMQ